MAELRVLVIADGRAQAVRDAVGSHEPPHADAAAALDALAQAAPGADVAWIDSALEYRLTPPMAWPRLRRHDLEMLHLGDIDLGTPAVDSLGWIDCESPYLLDSPANMRRPTWLVSPRAGLVRGALLTAMGFSPHLGLATALADIARRGMPHGLFPMAEPELWRPDPEPCPVPNSGHGIDSTAVAHLLRRGLDRRWLAVWLLANVLYRRRLPILAAARAHHGPAPPAVETARLDRLRPESDISGSPSLPKEITAVDVVIPTLDRPTFLADLLADLAAQDLPPRRVVIVDQHPEDAVPNEETPEPEVRIEPAGARPFAVVWQKVTWMGACRARNLGLASTDAPWVLLLDDDIRIAPDFIRAMLDTAKAYGAQVINPRVHLPEQDPASPTGGHLPRLWPRMAGVALLSRAACDAAGGFDRRLDGGYGEDYDYGMRLRRRGFFVVYDPAIPVLHLKAPRGGFRTHHSHPWPQEGAKAPKPSPTVLLSRRLHQTATMGQGFLLFYILAHLRSTPPWRWLWTVPRLVWRWRASVRWTDRLERSADG